MRSCLAYILSITERHNTLLGIFLKVGTRGVEVAIS